MFSTDKSCLMHGFLRLCTQILEMPIKYLQEALSNVDPSRRCYSEQPEGVLAAVGHVEEAVLVLVLLVDGGHQSSCSDQKWQQQC